MLRCSIIACPCVSTNCKMEGKQLAAVSSAAVVRRGWTEVPSREESDELPKRARLLGVRQVEAGGSGRPPWR